jgi:hypothetical protein
MVFSVLGPARVLTLGIFRFLKVTYIHTHYVIPKNTHCNTYILVYIWNNTQCNTQAVQKKIGLIRDLHNHDLIGGWVWRTFCRSVDVHKGHPPRLLFRSPKFVSLTNWNCVSLFFASLLQPSIKLPLHHLPKFHRSVEWHVIAGHFTDSFA